MKHINGKNFWQTRVLYCRLGGFFFFFVSNSSLVLFARDQWMNGGPTHAIANERVNTLLLCVFYIIHYSEATKHTDRKHRQFPICGVYNTDADAREYQINESSRNLQKGSLRVSLDVPKRQFRAKKKKNIS